MVRHADLAAEFALAPEDAEEQGTEPGVLGGEQEGHHRHRGVDGPVGSRPRGRLLPETAAGLVRFRVALQVGPWVGDGQGDHRRVEQPLPPERRTPFLGQGDVPEAGSVVTFEHDQVPPLGLARRRRTRCQVDEVVEHTGRERIRPERPGHAPPPDDVCELAHRTSSASWSRSQR